MKARKLNELERPELKSMFVSLISGHDKETEIAYLLALFAAIKLPLSSAGKHDVTECDISELIDIIETGILNQNGAGLDEEEKAWSMVLDSLHPEKIFDIITNIDYYMNRYNAITKPLEQLEYTMLKIFTEMEVV
ncbi:MAG: hypothetical protein GX796_05525 [Clostridiaceae bacterium]|jgi:hypothetical protein|nr:hypothetical protein [Clostridiaceae bacterium]